MTQGNDLIDDLRDQLTRMVEQTPAPAAGGLAAAAGERGRRIRAGRRVGGALAVAACLVAVAVPVLGHGDRSPGPGPTRTTSSATPTTSTAYDQGLAYRVTERCRRSVCGALRVAAIEADGTTYRPRDTGSQPLRQGALDLSMKAGDRAGDALALAGVTSSGGARPSFRVYVDGRRVGHYAPGRLVLLPLPSGRHEVRVEADQYLPALGARLVVADLRPSR